MNDQPYTPPKVWTGDDLTDNRFSKINRPVSGATHEKALPQGKHPFQLHSVGTPNGAKVTILFEELLEQGIKEAEYDAFLVNIMEGEQFGSGFVDINPNSKIPALLDTTTQPPTRIFESGAILLYLAEKFDAFIPKDHRKKTECISWLMWQMSNGPILGGGFGHFYAYAPEKLKYPIDRFTMEIKRHLDVLNKHLSKNEYMAGDEYSIADIAIWPWYGMLVTNRVYDAAEFLDAHTYEHVLRWTAQIEKRPAVQRGKKVNCTWGKPENQLHERHDASDFQLKTQDKLMP